MYIVYMQYDTPSVIHTFGPLSPLSRVFGLESLGIEMCMDESLDRRYLSLAVWHDFGLPDRRSQSEQPQP